MAFCTNKTKIILIIYIYFYFINTKFYYDSVPESYTFLSFYCNIHRFWTLSIYSFQSFDIKPPPNDMDLIEWIVYIWNQVSPLFLEKLLATCCNILVNDFEQPFCKPKMVLAMMVRQWRWWWPWNYIC